MFANYIITTYIAHTKRLRTVDAILPHSALHNATNCISPGAHLKGILSYRQSSIPGLPAVLVPSQKSLCPNRPNRPNRPNLSDTVSMAERCLHPRSRWRTIEILWCPYMSLHLYSTDHPTFNSAGGPVLRTLRKPVPMCRST